MKRQMDRAYLQEAARAIDARLPDNYTFILLACPISGTMPAAARRMVYVSNMERPDAIAALKEWLIKASGEEEWMKHLK